MPSSLSATSNADWRLSLAVLLVSVSYGMRSGLYKIQT